MLDETAAFLVAIYLSAIIICVFASIYLTINGFDGASLGIFGLAVLLIIRFPSIKTSGDNEKCKAKKY